MTLSCGLELCSIIVCYSYYYNSAQDGIYFSSGDFRVYIENSKTMASPAGGDFGFGRYIVLSQFRGRSDLPVAVCFISCNFVG